MWPKPRENGNFKRFLSKQIIIIEIDIPNDSHCVKRARI